MLAAILVTAGTAPGHAAAPLADSLGAAASAGDASPPPTSHSSLVSRGWAGQAFRSDRLAHASLALGIGVGVGILSREPAAGAGAALALSLAKEFLDDRFDRGDLAAGAIGAGVAALIVAALTR